jgi:ubiquinone/menaquinone biosynthesis C-methylase UbiE
MPLDPEHHYCALAMAFLRGTLDRPQASEEELLNMAKAQEIRIHRFKRKDGPARVTRALSTLEGLQPSSLLDIGSGRGTFLWPLLHRFPDLNVAAIDALEHRVRDIEATRLGGIDRVSAQVADVCSLPFEEDEFDVVTVLEVLEHLKAPALAAAEVLRVARRFTVASVPSTADDNPEHIQLFTPKSLTELFMDAGAERVQIDHVHNHMIAVIR